MSNFFELKNKYVLKSFFFFLGCLITTLIMFLFWSKYDFPVEAANVLINSSFTGGTTGWTLTGDAAYSSAEYQDSAGSVGWSGTGRKVSGAGTITHTLSATLNADDLINLSLYWKKLCYDSADPLNATCGYSNLYVRIKNGSTTYYEWSETTTSNALLGSWTSMSEEISSYITTTGTYTVEIAFDVQAPNNKDVSASVYVDNLSLEVSDYITVGTTGTQNSSVEANTADFEVGGAFTFIRNSGSTSVTSITVSETGTISDANLSGLILYYKQEATCSTTIPVDATQFNSTAGTFTSGKSTVTGTMSVGTSQVCIYTEVDIGSGASNGETIEIQISNPSTEVIASAGVVSPSTTVAISGTTTVQVNMPPNFISFSNDSPKDPGQDANFTATTANEFKFDDGKEERPWSVTFSSDGTNVYIAGTDSDSVYQYTLSTPWDISTAIYSKKSFEFPSTFATTLDVSFSPDGSNMYILENAIEDIAYQYQLSTPWDISTATYTSKSFDVGTQESSPTGISFKSDGTAMYVMGYNTDNIYQYSLATAWDISTATYTSKSFDVGSQESDPTGMYFKSDGTAIYVVGYNTSNVYQYSLSTAWDISTTSYSSKSFSVSTQETYPYSVTFKLDGTTIYIVGANSDTVYQYSLSTAWDVSTATYANKSFSVQSWEGRVQTLSFKPDGSTLYIAGMNNHTVYQFTLSSPWDVFNASYADKSFYFGSQFTFPASIAFSSDGASMYIINSNNLYNEYEIYQYSLSTAWDVSTATYANKSFSLASEEKEAESVDFNSDGTTMYIIGYDTDNIYQYSLSTAWDISTASYTSKSYFVGSQESTVYSVKFKSDGTAMYIVGSNSDTVYQYSLSTAWDVSTATYANKSFSVQTQEINPVSVTFNSDGTGMYIVGYDSDTVFKYTLSTAWEVSTATLDSSDPNGDPVMLLVCKTAGVTGTACDGGATDTICSSSLVESEPSCTYSVPIPTPDASYNAYPYVFDSTSLGSTSSLQGVADTYTINNVGPTVSNVTINGGSAINLSAGTTQAVNITGSITDNNSCNDISSVLGYAYRSGVGYTTQAVNSYYFDGSVGWSDPDSTWTNETNAIDGSTSTNADSTSFNSPLILEGTNAPSSGGSITQVRFRFWNMNTNAWSSYYSVSEPSSGWTWSILTNLEQRVTKQTDSMAIWYHYYIYYNSEVLMSIEDFNILDNPPSRMEIEVSMSAEGCSNATLSNYNNCYPDITCTVDTGTCTGDTDASADYTCTANLQYFADPTDTNTDFSAENWLSTIKATDDNSLSNNSEVSTGVELNSLMAFNITNEVNYGALGIGESNDPLDRTTVITPTGNIPLNHEVSGPSHMCTDFPTCTGSTIAIEHQKYALSSSTAYTSATALSTTATEVATNVPKPTTTTPTTKSIWWGMLVPEGTNNGSYDGTITITGYKWWTGINAPESPQVYDGSTYVNSLDLTYDGFSAMSCELSWIYKGSAIFKHDNSLEQGVYYELLFSSNISKHLPEEKTAFSSNVSENSRSENVSLFPMSIDFPSTMPEGSGWWKMRMWDTSGNMSDWSAEFPITCTCTGSGCPIIAM